jgi:hypothetical protein
MNLQQVKDDFKERINEMDSYFKEMFDEMNGTVESVKIMARDSVSAKEKELSEMVTKQAQSL